MFENTLHSLCGLINRMLNSRCLELCFHFSVLRFLYRQRNTRRIQNGNFDQDIWNLSNGLYSGHGNVNNNVSKIFSNLLNDEIKI